MLTFTPASPEWAAEFKRARSEVAHRHAYYARMVQYFETRIAAWKPGTLMPVIAEAKYLSVFFMRGSWIARSEKSGRVIEQGRRLADVLSRAKWNGWTLPPGTEMPSEYKTSDLYRAAAERPGTPETVALVGRHVDPVTARVVMRAYEGLTPAQREKFDVVPLTWVAKVMRDLHADPTAVRAETLRTRLIVVLD